MSTPKRQSTCLTPSGQHSYSFRNTPTRNEGEGAYDNFFAGKVKIAKNAFVRPANLMLNQTCANDDLVSVKNVLKKQQSSKGKENDPDFHSEASDSDCDSSQISTCSKPLASATINRTILKLKGEATSKTPAPNKKKSSIVRRNTISSAAHTPSLQKRTFSKISHDSLTIYEKARIKLHVANTPDCLPCRDKQFSDIFSFIETNLKNQTGGCMYVCGVPGTGKTLTTRQVIACLKESVADKMLAPFRFIDVNAFQVTEPHQIYKLIYKELTEENVSAEHAVMLLEKKFEQKSSESIVLLVDELDMLCTKKQDVLYNLFDWPYKKNSKWIVVAIANAMNLPEQVMGKISSRLGLTRMNFQPYSHAELEEIVTLRLQELAVFEREAIIFAARKVAAVSGDARRALEICRRATELAERENANPAMMTMTNIGHVDLAIKHMFSSAKILALTHCSQMEKFFMKSISMLYQKSGIEETSLKNIFEEHSFVCKSQGILPLNRTQLLNVCCTLASLKLILLEPSKNIFLQRVRCNMSTDDIDYVLNDKK
jgi:origin recognition complex subunit 1